LLRASSPEPGAELGTVCLKAGTALLASIKEGAFQNVLMISQLLPVLNRKTYLDLIHPECQAPRGTEPFTTASQASRERRFLFFGFFFFFNSIGI
jgi:hypothetical protein